MTTTQPRERLAELRERAKQIVDGAERENRALTDSEHSTLDEMFTEGDQLHAQIVKADKDAETSAKVGAMGRALGFSDDDTGQTKNRPAKLKAVRGSDWGATWKEALGAKDLLSPGTVPVSIPVEPAPVREGEPVQAVRQLIGSRQVDQGGHFAYLRQTLRDNQAATVADGALKPTSAYQLERVDDRARVIAHLSEPMHRNLFADAPSLQQFLNAELQLGLELALENEIVNGDGSTSNGLDRMTGLLNTSGIQHQGFDENAVRTARRAVGLLENAGLAPAGYIMAPADWEEIELAASEHADYVLDRQGGSMPVERASRRLWGLPVVLSHAVEEGTGILVESDHLEVRVRESGSLTATDSPVVPHPDGDGEFVSGFATNQIQWRCEGRFGLAIGRPLGVVEIDLDGS